ncbi:MAG TPA: hypothetical protein VFO34_01665 [Candidatus Acidoferrales bacterium]|nr:hypothetical protein [Candidatus Acidoferrales bacterium]
MKILVTFAVEPEFAPWRGRHRFSAVRKEKVELHEAEMHGAEITVLLTGIGPLVSRRNVTEAFVSGVFEQHSFDVCISSGLAGALRGNWAIGDILVPRSVKSDTSADREVGAQFLPDATMLEAAEKFGARVVDRCLTSDRMISSAAEKSSLGAEADAVEMESYGILSEASAWGARGVCVRAIGDVASEDLPINFSKTIDEQGDVSYMRVLGELARNPRAMPHLVRFGMQSRTAAQALADFLDRFVPELAAPSRQGIGAGAVAQVKKP